MKKFEYRLLWITTDTLPGGKIGVNALEPGVESQGSFSVIPLAAIGEDGWDIVPMRPFQHEAPRGIPSSSFLALFKRGKESPDF